MSRELTLDDARALLDDAILAIHEKNVVSHVIAAGFHPFHRAGIELVEMLRMGLRDGSLEPADISQETVWRLADERELEIDLTPILVTKERT